VGRFLTAAAEGPCALVVEGDPGIGKTTVWQAAIEIAQARGFRVLSAQAAASESVLAYSGLTDLLSALDDADYPALPKPQRQALDRIMLRTNDDGVPSDQRAISAAILAVLSHLAADAPVLVAIDDLQWVDESSAFVVAFAARRLSSRVGVLGMVRSDQQSTESASWLQLRHPERLRRTRAKPLSLSVLHAVISERLGRSLPRPTLHRILEVSAGNPLYALELARAMTADSGVDIALPNTLTAMVRARIGGLGADAHAALVAMACAATPTVDMVAGVLDVDGDEVVRQLESAERQGIVTIEGNSLRFTHPLLAQGAYDRADPALRRTLHRRLAAIVEHPELRARHLALAGVVGDPVTLAALDDAATAARFRGAAAAAAELADMALRLGGDTAERRIRCAQYNFDAGNAQRSRTLVTAVIAGPVAGSLRGQALNLLATVAMWDNNYVEAIDVLTRALTESGDDRLLRTRMLIGLAIACLNSSDLDAAARHIDDAIALAEQIDRPQLLSQALGIRVLERFTRGDGLDDVSLQRAVELEDPAVSMPSAFRPSMQKPLLLAWTGKLDQAHEEMAVVLEGCLERGEESEQFFAELYDVLIDVWRGRFTDAVRRVDDIVERARQLGGDISLFVALTARAIAATYVGRVEQARRDTADAISAAQRCSSSTLLPMAIANLGFLELSVGDHAAALATIEPLRAGLEAMPNACEFVLASFLPDAVESLIALGRLDGTEPLISRLQHHGERLQRAWLQAVGARCRAMQLAARGDLEAAHGAATQAMIHHDRLPMPFERARTELFLGQLQHRRRRKEAASVTLNSALNAFEQMGTPLWADRARDELARINAGADSARELTPTEQRVAELAATGMTNREVAAAMFISPKTVEVKLSRAYRKLGIRSRAELGRRMAGIVDQRREKPDSAHEEPTAPP